ncbi:MAG TPA: DUF6600 domain-containing protein [Pyrinomonadaceae bacterium]|jgi:hypothetical protein
MRAQKLLRLTSLLLLLVTLTLHTVPTYAVADDEDDYGDEYEETARVVRVSLLRGEVSLRRAGDSNWERATLNLPLVEGDTLSTGRDAHLELQIDARNFVRINADSVLHIVTLRDEGIALSLSEGTATLRLARFDRDKEYFEIDAPKTTVAAEQHGIYRLDVSREGRVRVTVRDDGHARIYSENSGFTLRENRTAEFVPANDEAGGDWELSAAASFDDWDKWTDERERYLASRLRYEDRERYYDRDVWGAEELDAYGDWSYVETYGWIWRPHVTVINHYNDWAPYRYGSWRWCPPYGWTWVGDEPWGWAPYHYGRWVYHNNNWCWAPRGYGYKYKRAWWRPALVAFVYLASSYGEHVAWYPLGHRQRDPHSRHWQRRERLSPLRAREAFNLRRANPAYLRAVTTLPAREFGRATTRARPATSELARRAVEGEPVSGRLPITPVDASRRVETTREGRTRLNIARPTPVGPAARAMSERRTGAAARTPGVALDNELRRTRIYNNREPRVASPELNTGRGSANDREISDPRTTGAVERPARRTSRPSVDGRIDNNDGTLNTARPTRPVRPSIRDERNPIDDNDNTMRTREPSERPAVERPRPIRERPDLRSRPDERDVDENRTEPETRRERPTRPTEERAPVAAPRHTERPDVRERKSAPDDEPDSSPQPRRESPARMPERSPAPREERRESPPPREERQERPAPREERHESREERPAPRQDSSPPPKSDPPKSNDAPPPPSRDRPSSPSPRERPRSERFERYKRNGLPSASAR